MGARSCGGARLWVSVSATVCSECVCAECVCMCVCALGVYVCTVCVCFVCARVCFSCFTCLSCLFLLLLSLVSLLTFVSLDDDLALIECLCCVRASVASCVGRHVPPPLSWRSRAGEGAAGDGAHDSGVYRRGSPQRHERPRQLRGGRPSEMGAGGDGARDRKDGEAGREVEGGESAARMKEAGAHASHGGAARRAMGPIKRASLIQACTAVRLNVGVQATAPVFASSPLPIVQIPYDRPSRRW